MGDTVTPLALQARLFLMLGGYESYRCPIDTTSIFLPYTQSSNPNSASHAL